MSEGKKETHLKCGILGCTGSVGQRFVHLLENHPWFKIHTIGASERSVGKKYGEVVHWVLPTPIPPTISTMTIVDCNPKFYKDCDFVFSALDASVAGTIETEFSNSEIPVFSNARNHRYDDDVPILIPSVNEDHVEVIPRQLKARGLKKGFIVTNANCSSTGLAVVLKPLDVAFGLKKVHVVTLQAISGAGYPGVSAYDIVGNVIPYISGEEEKLELEPKKILGKLRPEINSEKEKLTSPENNSEKEKSTNPENTGKEKITTPENNPGNEKISAPENNTRKEKITPENNPEKEKVTTPENNPGKEKETTPENNPGKEKETTPENNHGKEKVTTPENNPGKEKVTTPENNPGKEKVTGPEFISANFIVSAQCNRVQVIDGHTECVSLEFQKEVTPEEVKKVLQNYVAPYQKYSLPSAPPKDIVLLDQNDRPQPRLDLSNGFAVSVGRVRPCSLLSVKLVLLSHNTIIGAAGGSIVNAELAKVKGYI